MAEWKKVIVSGSTADLNIVSASNFHGTLDKSLTDGNGIADFTYNGSAAATVTVELDGSTLALGSGGVKVADGGVDTTQLAADAVTTAKITDANVTLAKLANAAANTVIVRDANSSGVLSAKAVSNTQILIGDGTGFTAAALSGDVTMTNAGVVTIGNDAVETAMIAHSLGQAGVHAFTGSFSGSFVGDGSNLTGISADSFDFDSLDAVTSLNQGDVFGVSVSGTEKKITYSNLEDDIFGNVSGDATVAAGGALTIANDAVSNAKLADITRGSVKVGGASNAPTDLDAKTSGQILVGDGTDIASVAVSGDVALAANGAVTIQANAVEGSMLNTNTADTSTIEVSSNTLSVLKVPNALTAGAGLNNGGGTFDGAASRTFSVDSGSMVAYYSSSIFSTLSGDISVTAAGVATVTGAVTNASLTDGNGIADFSFNGSGAASVAVELDGSTLSVGSSGLKISNGGVDTTQLAGDAVDGTKIADNAIDSEHYADGSIDTAHIANDAVTGDKLANDITIANNLTVTNDLQVNGDLVTLNTANLNIEDRYILLHSGSSGTADSGVIFGGTSGTAQQGKAIIWDASYNSNDGRLAVSTTDVAFNSTSNFGAGTAGYYIAGVYDGSAANAATAKADHRGNIRVDSSDDIYIYV